MPGGNHAASGGRAPPFKALLQPLWSIKCSQLRTLYGLIWMIALPSNLQCRCRSSTPVMPNSPAAVLPPVYISVLRRFLCGGLIVLHGELGNPCSNCQRLIDHSKHVQIVLMSVELEACFNLVMHHPEYGQHRGVPLNCCLDCILFPVYKCHSLYY